MRKKTDPGILTRVLFIFGIPANRPEIRPFRLCIGTVLLPHVLKSNFSPKNNRKLRNKRYLIARQMNENGRIDIIENCAANKYMLQQEKRQNISAMTVYVIPPAPTMDESAISRVAPRTGAWIEISCLDNAITSFSGFRHLPLLFPFCLLRYLCGFLFECFFIHSVNSSENPMRRPLDSILPGC